MLNARRLEGSKARRLEGSKVRRLEGSKAQRFDDSMALNLVVGSIYGQNKGRKQMLKVRRDPNKPYHQLIEEVGVRFGLHKNY
jgi:hypothetical protein